MNLTNKLKNIVSSHRIRASAMLAFLMALSIVGPTSAQTVLQGFEANDSLQRGMLVTLDVDNRGRIKAITQDTLSQIKGVVADSKDSPVTLSGEGQKMFVATEGTYEVLVSNENGKIKTGDYISGSSLAGVGMKADESQSIIVGRAVGPFEGAGDGISKTSLENGSSVSLGRIRVDIGVGNNPAYKAPAKESLPGALERIAGDLAGKSVSAARVYLALTVLLITVGIAGSVLFSGVRGTVISIGRNPLSKGLIYKGLIQVTLLSLIIFITGLFGVYLLIKL